MKRSASVNIRIRTRRLRCRRGTSTFNSTHQSHRTSLSLNIPYNRLKFGDLVPPSWSRAPIGLALFSHYFLRYKKKFRDRVPLSMTLIGLFFALFIAVLYGANVPCSVSDELCRRIESLDVHYYIGPNETGELKFSHLFPFSTGA